MISSIIPSLIAKDGDLVINALPDCDLHVGTMDKNHACQSVHIRMHSMSRFDGWIKGVNPHGFFMRLKKFNDEYKFPLQQDVDPVTDLSETTQAEAILFEVDYPNHYLSVVKTAKNIVGVQTFYTNNEDVSQQGPLTWLGRCDLKNTSSNLLNDFFNTCDDLYTSWSKRGKPIEKVTQTIGDISHPETFVYH